MGYVYNDPFVVDTVKHGSGGTLNFRERPSTVNSSVLATIPNRTQIYCDKEQEANNWMPCTYNGWYGFVQSKFLIGTNAYGTSSSTGAGNYDGISNVNCKATVRGGSLNMRAQDEDNAAILLSIPNGATIHVANTFVGQLVWLRAVYNNTMGFVKHQFIEIHPSQTSYVVHACMRYGAPLLRKGSTGQYVTQLASDMRSYFQKSISTGSTFDDELYNAVKEVQAEYGLTQDGIVGNDTKEALYRFIEFG